MKPIRTDRTTRVLGAPQGWDAIAKCPCEGLPVTMADGNFYSYWRATWRERLAVLFGRPVRLILVGQAHPPVMLDTQT